MDTRYLQNRIYITAEEQSKIKTTRILLGGAGIGSVIAECSLRLGFERFTLIDNEIVKLSDLNRHNYTNADVGKFRVVALKQRLEEINPSVQISIDTLTTENIGKTVVGHDIAINAIEFKSDTPFKFDEVCKKYDIPVIHPYNLGWAGLATIVDSTGKQICDFSNDWKAFDVNLLKYITSYYRYWGGPQMWLENVLKYIDADNKIDYLPQLSISSWITGGLVAKLLFDIVTGEKYKRFPKFYFLSSKCL